MATWAKVNSVDETWLAASILSNATTYAAFSRSCSANKREHLAHATGHQGNRIAIKQEVGIVRFQSACHAINPRFGT